MNPALRAILLRRPLYQLTANANAAAVALSGRHWFVGPTSGLTGTAFTDNGATTQAGVGDVLGAWASREGGAILATQGTAANKPTLSSLPNGNIAALISASDFLTTADLAYAGARTVVIAFRATTLGTFYLMDGSSGIARTAVYITSGGNIYFNAGTQAASAGGIIQAGVPYVAEAVFNGATSELYVNSTLRASGNTGAHTSTAYVLGASNAGTASWDGPIAYVGIFPGVLTSVQRATFRELAARLIGL